MSAYHESIQTSGRQIARLPFVLAPQQPSSLTFAVYPRPFQHVVHHYHQVVLEMIASSLPVDQEVPLRSSSWPLTVLLETRDGTVKQPVSISVWGESTVATVLHGLHEAAHNIEILKSHAWNEHSLFWTDRSMWLLQPLATLDEVGIQTHSKVRLVPTRSPILLQLPDLQTRKVQVNFTKSVFTLVSQLCKELGIRHAEELSLARAFPNTTNGHSSTPKVARSSSQNQRNKMTPSRRAQSSSRTLNRHGKPTPTSTNTLINSSVASNVNDSSQKAGPSSPFLPVPNANNSGPQSATSFSTLRTLHKPTSTSSIAILMDPNASSEEQLSDSPLLGYQEAVTRHMVSSLASPLLRARRNGLWLDSSKTLLEQGIEPHLFACLIPFLLLRFKYYNFYDLRECYDTIRINQLFHQARWSILSEELATTEEESVWFAALQVHIDNLPKHVPNVDNLDKDERDALATTTGLKSAEEEVDEMLDELTRILQCGDEVAAKLSHFFPHHEMVILSDWVKCHKPGKLTLQGYKKFWLVLRQGEIQCHKTMLLNGMADSTIPLETWPLYNCLIQNEMQPHSKNHILHISFPNSQPLPEVKLKFATEETCLKWLASCQRAASFSSSSLKNQDCQDFKMDGTTRKKCLTNSSGPHQQHLDPMKILASLCPEDMVSPKYRKRLSTKTLREKILEVYPKVGIMSKTMAKLEYIQAWQKLPGFGVAFFVVRLRQEKGDHLLGITSNRILLMDHHNSHHETVMRKSWLLSELQSWHVNWQLQELVMIFHKSERVVLSPVMCSCKVLHEFIGGYVCLALRTPEKNQNMDEALFRKFTCDMQSTE